MTAIRVWNSSLFRGRSFSSAATASRCSSLNPASSVPFGASVFVKAVIGRSYSRVQRAWEVTCPKGRLAG